jgi:homocysteine S-methyltransferase
VTEFAAAFRSGTPIVTDGGIETRIMFETDLPMDPELQVAALVPDPAGAAALRSIYGSYIEAAAAPGLPIVIGTPTFRASLNFARRAGCGDPEAVRELNKGAVRLLRELREDSDHRPIFLAGVIGPSGDAYTPGEALAAPEAAAYHRLQAEALAEERVDFLFAPTFPSVDEALGVAMAMGSTGLPHVVSFVLDKAGRVLDGTSLTAAIERIDNEASPPPLYYSISCVYPDVAARALEDTARGSKTLVKRIAELKDNGSPLGTDELVRLDHIESTPPELFAELLWSLHESHPALRVIGGCCGTDDRHIRALAERMVSGSATDRGQ